MINLKKYYHRMNCGDNYLIPKENIEEFDEWLALEDAEEIWSHPRAVEFKKYIIPNMDNILLYIHPDDLK